MALYHKDVFLPRRIKSCVPVGSKRLVWTDHAKRATNDRYGQITIIEWLDFGKCEIIEVEHYSTGIAKLVLRAPDLTSKGKDVIFVVLPRDGAFVVKSVWINLADDTHKTLNRSMYEQVKRN